MSDWRFWLAMIGLFLALWAMLALMDAADKGDPVTTDGTHIIEAPSPY